MKYDVVSNQAKTYMLDTREKMLSTQRETRNSNCERQSFQKDFKIFFLQNHVM